MGIEMLSRFLGEMCGSRRVRCHVVSDERSAMVKLLLEGVGLSQHFASVIGYDHATASACDEKRHLILLQLQRSLKRKHDEVLYVGSDKQVTEHLTAIDVCKSYLCQTKGLTKSGLDA